MAHTLRGVLTGAVFSATAILAGPPLLAQPTGSSIPPDVTRILEGIKAADKDLLAVSEEDVLEGLESANAYSTVSLDAGTDSDEGPAAVLDTIGVDDEALEGVEYRLCKSWVREGTGWHTFSRGVALPTPLSVGPGDSDPPHGPALRKVERASRGGAS